MNTPEPDNENHEVLNQREARQGQRSFALRVLVISLSLIVVAFALAYLFGEATEDTPPETAPQEDITGTEPPPDVPPAPPGE